MINKWIEKKFDKGISIIEEEILAESSQLQGVRNLDLDKNKWFSDLVRLIRKRISKQQSDKIFKDLSYEPIKCNDEFIFIIRALLSISFYYNLNKHFGGFLLFVLLIVLLVYIAALVIRNQIARLVPIVISKLKKYIPEE
ncbi:MAG: hypothetical protein IPK03_15010 [Bacteroidetes bacterium]|nr:hypothetical protein [Bacteroidota bacterium]